MRWRGFYIGRGQRVAALFLLILLAECLWIIGHRPLGSDDYRYAVCGREMWERPNPVAGYFTTCGNLHGDGTLAYRVAGLPLTTQRLVLLATDRFRAPANRLYTSGGLRGSTWENRHQLSWVRWLLRVPFALFAVWLGGGLWWVSRRLFGEPGGALALGLYTFCPAVLRFATTPNNEVLAMWGLYGLVYTAIGVAHALQGPRHKWKPRILLLTVALGLTAAAHLLAAMLGFLAGAIFLFYLADRRRSAAMPILIGSAVGALVILFASFAFRLASFTYVFTGGGARFWFTTENLRRFFTSPDEAALTIAAVLALGLYLRSRRSRYFGNTAPLLVFAGLVLLYTSQVVSAPWLWALPFLLTFIGGVFADVFETRHRLLFQVLAAAILLTQAVACFAWIRGVLA